MKSFPLLVATAIIASPAYAEQTRQLDAHEHGVGQLNIAVDGSQIAMELHAPGADIVGFEYVPESDQDRATVEDAIATLTDPLNLFVLPAAAGCVVTQADAGLEGEDDHEDHAGEDHEEDGHDDHDGHEDNHDDHVEHEDDHDGHDDHEEEAGHTEFHAEYLLTCAEPAAITTINFAYFDSFPNALEVEVQIITDTGAQSFEVERDMPDLDLSGLF